MLVHKWHRIIISQQRTWIALLHLLFISNESNIIVSHINLEPWLSMNQPAGITARVVAWKKKAFGFSEYSKKYISPVLFTSESNCLFTL
jgi:hypothetical protein